MVEAVHFGVMTDEEVRKLSVKKISNRNLLNTVGRPEPGGLYDPALGPLEDHTPCKTCGLRYLNCHGHCGHIDLVSLVYHPLLFNMLHRLLQNTCLACYHFKAHRNEVELCICKLKLIMKGDILGARNLDSMHPDDSNENPVLTGLPEGLEHKDSEYNWTSFQLTEAISVLSGFLKKKSGKCYCGAKNPPITKPTFGWLHMGGLKDTNIKENIIRWHKLDGLLVEEDADKSLSEVENTEDHDAGLVASKTRRKKKDDLKLEFLKWKKPRYLLPTEVRRILELLWQNEAQLCSFTCDIQQRCQNTSQKKAAFMMFFLKTLLVPPIKFRPPSKGGDSWVL